MMMVVRGDISLGESDPLVDSLKSQFPNPKAGALLIIEDLLEMSLQQGNVRNLSEVIFYCGNSMFKVISLRFKINNLMLWCYLNTVNNVMYENPKNI